MKQETKLKIVVLREQMWKEIDQILTETEKKIMELKGTDNIHDVWPNLEVFFHGAVAFGPYKNIFQKMISFRTHYMI